MELYSPQLDQFENTGITQSKLEGGEYVRSQGKLVPKIYSSAEVAIYAASRGESVLVRGEHSDGYNGPSGLGQTFKLRPGQGKTVDGVYPVSVYEKMLEDYKSYASIANIDVTDYLEQASCSFWEEIPGTNVTVVADDTVEGQYHVFGYGYDEGQKRLAISGAVVQEDGSIWRSLEQDDLSKGIEERYCEIIEFYNSVRRLDKFNDFHCPIIEMQVSNKDGRIYFLQYHRSRDLSPTEACLDDDDFDRRDGWIKADAVRGAYLGDRALALTICYPGKSASADTAPVIQYPEVGYHGTGSNVPYINEYLGRHRTAHVMPAGFRDVYRNIASNHSSRSIMFKPQVSILINPELEPPDHIPREIWREAFKLANHHGRIARLDTQIVSDGRRGFVKYGDKLTVV